jgi:hypothetical protein
MPFILMGLLWEMLRLHGQIRYELEAGGGGALILPLCTSPLCPPPHSLNCIVPCLRLLPLAPSPPAQIIEGELITYMQDNFDASEHYSFTVLQDDATGEVMLVEPAGHGDDACGGLSRRVRWRVRAAPPTASPRPDNLLQQRSSDDVGRGPMRLPERCGAAAAVTTTPPRLPLSLLPLPPLQSGLQQLTSHLHFASSTPSIGSPAAGGGWYV